MHGTAAKAVEAYRERQSTRIQCGIFPVSQGDGYIENGAFLMSCHIAA